MSRSGDFGTNRLQGFIQGGWERGDSGHKQVKLHGLCTGSSESSSHAPVGGSTSSAYLSPPISQNGALGLSSDNLINFNSPPPGQNINGLMETLNIN